MSATFVNQRMVHYEVFGRGQPVIFLHSWLGSWRYWMPSMEMISDRFRAYAMDFWGFGESDRSGQEFDIQLYVDQLLGFMHELGMVRANLVGHGLGGVVAVRAAIQSPNTFLKLVLTGTPIDGDALSGLTKTGALSRLMGKTTVSDAMNKLIRNIQTRIADEEIRTELLEDIGSTTSTVMDHVFESLLDIDISEDLEKLSTPTLGVYSANDAVVPVSQAELFEEYATEHQVLTMDNYNHFPFLEEGNVFNRLLQDFLTSPGASAVQIKEEWRRRVKQTDYL